MRAEADHTELPAGCCNTWFGANVWHQFADHTAVLREAERIVRGPARIAILDWRPDAEPEHGPPLEHRISAESAVAELKAAERICFPGPDWQVFMARARKSDAEEDGRRARVARQSHGSRQADRLKDEVYREMYRLESHHAGAEMALARAVLRAWVQGCCLKQCGNIAPWLKKISPICLEMIEASLCPERAETILESPSGRAPCDENSLRLQNCCGATTLQRSSKPSGSCKTPSTPSA